MPIRTLEEMYRAYGFGHPGAFARANPVRNAPDLVVKIEAANSADEDVSKLANNFLVGCDPEFVVVDKPEVVYNVQTAGVPHEGEVGWDHGGLVVEIRPKPAMGTYAVVKRIQGTIQKNTSLALIMDRKWRAGAAFRTKTAETVVDPITGVRGRERLLTLGGHVHFDIAPPPTREEDEHVRRMKALDRGTTYLEKLDILPKDESTLRRIHGSKATTNDAKYGQLGDWRPARGGSHGGYHIEYRTMASWLYHPKVAYMAMTLAKLCAVSPQLALDTLKARNVSYENLKALFELYRHKDDNAKRALENLLDGDIKAIQCDPDVDFKKNWKELSF